MSKSVKKIAKRIFELAIQEIATEYETAALYEASLKLKQAEIEIKNLKIRLEQSEAQVLDDDDQSIHHPRVQKLLNDIHELVVENASLKQQLKEIVK